LDERKLVLYAFEEHGDHDFTGRFDSVMEEDIDTVLSQAPGGTCLSLPVLNSIWIQYPELFISAENQTQCPKRTLSGWLEEQYVNQSASFGVPIGVNSRQNDKLAYPTDNLVPRLNNPNEIHGIDIHGERWPSIDEVHSQALTEQNITQLNMTDLLTTLSQDRLENFISHISPRNKSSVSRYSSSPASIRPIINPVKLHRALEARASPNRSTSTGSNQSKRSSVTSHGTTSELQERLKAVKYEAVQLQSSQSEAPQVLTLASDIDQTDRRLGELLLSRQQSAVPIVTNNAHPPPSSTKSITSAYLPFTLHSSLIPQRSSTSLSKDILNGNLIAHDQPNKESQPSNSTFHVRNKPTGLTRSNTEPRKYTVASQSGSPIPLLAKPNSRNHSRGLSDPFITTPFSAKFIRTVQPLGHDETSAEHNAGRVPPMMERNGSASVYQAVNGGVSFYPEGYDQEVDLSMLHENIRNQNAQIQHLNAVVISLEAQCKKWHDDIVELQKSNIQLHQRYFQSNSQVFDLSRQLNLQGRQLAQANEELGRCKEKINEVEFERDQSIVHWQQLLDAGFEPEVWLMEQGLGPT
jgi:hypothetical protein